MKILPKLSTRTVIILFSVIVLVCFALFLYWTIDKRVVDYRESQHAIAKQTSLVVSAEIERALEDRNILVKGFLEDNLPTIHQLSRNPDNEELFLTLNGKLKKYFTDFFTTNIASHEVELLIDDFDGLVGEMCLQDMGEFVDNGFHDARMHPNPVKNHYDVVVNFNLDGQRHIFFVSFSLERIANTLKLSSPFNQNIYVVQKDADHLIEVTELGDRHYIPDRLDFRMTDDELSRVMYEAPIKGTRWHVMMLHDEGLFTSYKSSLEKRAWPFFTLVSAIIILFSALLVSQVKRNEKYSSSLLKKNEEIESLNLVLEDLNKTLVKQATTDGLTGLFNRHSFDSYIYKEWNKAQRLGLNIHVSLIDIDFFKQYNDIYGHQAGDECIKMVAEVLKESYKRSNEHVARYGGEEFIIVETGNDDSDVKRQIDRFMKKVEDRQVEHKGSNIKQYVSVSIGTASSEINKVSTFKELIELADKALYKAKENGRDQAMYSLAA